MADPLLLNITIGESREWTAEELARLLSQYQQELRKVYAQLAIARATIADNTATIKRKNSALRNVNRRRRSLSQTVVRRRKYGK